MIKFKRLVSLVLCLVMLMSFAACSKDNGGESTTETTAPQTTEPTKAGKVLGEGDLLGTLYMDCNSDDYQGLVGKIEHIKTGMEPKFDSEYFRFVSPEEGVKIRLESIMYSPIVDSFEVTDTVFERTPEKGKIYEFECLVTETIPDHRLVVECGDARAEYYMVADGFEVLTKLQMIAESPKAIEQGSVFYRICVARAVSDVYYNDRLIKHEPEVVWNTLAYAVTLNEFEMIGTEDYVNMIGLSDWEADAYFSTLYPSLDESKTKLMEDGRVVAAHFSVGKKYLVEPHLFEKFCTDEFFGVQNNGDGTYSVKILVHDQRAPEVEFDRDRGLAVIVKPDANSPFGYIIKDVVDCDLPKG